MDLNWAKDFWVPLAVLLGASLGGSLLTWGVRSLGKKAKKAADVPAKLEEYGKAIVTLTEGVCKDREETQKAQARTDEAIRVLLSVSSHGNAGVRALVEANRQSLNGSYDRTMKHLDDADKEQQEFLTSSYGGK